MCVIEPADEISVNTALDWTFIYLCVQQVRLWCSIGVQISTVYLIQQYYSTVKFEVEYTAVVA